MKEEKESLTFENIGTVPEGKSVIVGIKGYDEMPGWQKQGVRQMAHRILFPLTKEQMNVSLSELFTTAD